MQTQVLYDKILHDITNCLASAQSSHATKDVQENVLHCLRVRLRAFVLS